MRRPWPRYKQVLLPLFSADDLITFTIIFCVLADFFQNVVTPLFKLWDQFLSSDLSRQLIANLNFNYNQWQSFTKKLIVRRHSMISESSSRSLRAAAPRRRSWSADESAVVDVAELGPTERRVPSHGSSAAQRQRQTDLRRGARMRNALISGLAAVPALRLPCRRTTTTFRAATRWKRNTASRPPIRKGRDEGSFIPLPHPFAAAVLGPAGVGAGLHRHLRQCGAGGRGTGVPAGSSEPAAPLLRAGRSRLRLQDLTSFCIVIQSDDVREHVSECCSRYPFRGPDGAARCVPSCSRLPLCSAQSMSIHDILKDCTPFVFMYLQMYTPVIIVRHSVSQKVLQLNLYTHSYTQIYIYI